MLSISVQSGIRVRKHSGNIHSNITVQIHCYHNMRSNITRILHHWSVQNMNYRRFTRYDTGRCSRAGRRNLKNQSTEWIRRIYYAIVMLSLHTLNNNRNFTKDQASESGHADLGLSKCNPMST